MKRMLVGATAIVGCTIAIAGWGVFATLRREFKDAQRNPVTAEALVELIMQLSQSIANISTPTIKHCDVKFDPIPDHLDANRAINVIATAYLPKGADQCQSEVGFYAAAFTVEPKEHVTVMLTKDQPSQEVMFNILPNQMGKQAMVYGSDEKSYTATPVVFQYPYISPALTIWFPILGTVFGGMLTLPWWLRFFGIPRAKDDDEDDGKAPERKSKNHKRHKASSA
jgi:hypothetical protein